MCRALLPPNAKPVVSSRLMKRGGMALRSVPIESAIAARSRGISSKGVFLRASWMRGSSAMESRMVWGCIWVFTLTLALSHRGRRDLAWLPVPELVGKSEGLGEAAGVDEDYGYVGV